MTNHYAAYSYMGTGGARCWAVEGLPHQTYMPGVNRAFTEAEANIIAFALNAVGEGFTLQATNFPRVAPADHRVYNGPTQGVAPT